MFFTELAPKLISWRKENKSISFSDWPKEIIFPTTLFDNLRTLEKYTASEGSLLFEKKQGSFGWEYALTVVLVGDQLYYGKPKSGDYNSVVPVQNIKLTPVEYKNNNSDVILNLSIGEHEQRTKAFRVELVKSSDFQFGTALVVHTHPKYYHGDGSHQYTFFSSADLGFLAHSPSLVLGLITKNTLWLVCKTSSFSSIDAKLLHEATIQETLGGDDAIKTYIAAKMRNTGLVFYYGKLGDKVKKISFTGNDNMAKSSTSNNTQTLNSDLAYKRYDNPLGKTTHKKARKSLKDVFILLILPLFLLAVLGAVFAYFFF